MPPAAAAYYPIEVTDMDNEHDTDMEAPAESDAIGIVVRDGAEAERPPRAVAFVWGGKVRPTPTLPYGRWKNMLTAA